MGVQESGLTLEGLAQRLETLERENTELRNEVTALRGSDARRNGPTETRGLVPRRDEERASGFEGPVSRRALLGKAGAAAVAAMAAGTLLYPRQAKADHYSDGIFVDYVSTHDVSARPDVANRRAITATNNSDTAGFATIEALNQGSGAAVNGESQGTGVRGITNGSGRIGVFGKSSALNPGPGVRGDGSIGVWGTAITSGQAGVYGNHDLFGPGVVGDGSGDYAGVWGRNSVSTGVRGQGKTGVLGVGSDVSQAGVKGEGPTGVWGVTSKTSYAGVYGEHTGTSGIGTVGIGKGADPGVLGRNSGGDGVKGEGSVGVRGEGQIGVRGESTSSSSVGVLGRNDGGTGVQGDGKNGVFGRGSSGYGGFFEGGKAQLRLVPKGSAGKPTTGAHAKGEISMDSAATLWVCTVAGTPGTWRKVATTAS